jgi:hypothetical protein
MLNACVELVLLVSCTVLEEEELLLHLRGRTGMVEFQFHCFAGPGHRRRAMPRIVSTCLDVGVSLRRQRDCVHRGCRYGDAAERGMRPMRYMLKLERAERDARTSDLRSDKMSELSNYPYILYGQNLL